MKETISQAVLKVSSVLKNLNLTVIVCLKQCIFLGYSKLSVQLRQSLNQLYSQIQNLRAHLSQQSASHLYVVTFS